MEIDGGVGEEQETTLKDFALEQIWDFLQRKSHWRQHYIDFLIFVNEFIMDVTQNSGKTQL